MADVIQIAIEAVDHASSAIGGIGSALGRLGKQSEDTASQIAKVSAATEATNAKLAQYGSATDSVTRTQNQLKVAEIELAEASQRLTRAQEELKNNTDPTKTAALNKELAEAQVQLDGAGRKVQDLSAKIEASNTVVETAQKKFALFGLSAEQIGSKMTQAGKIATVGLTLPIAGIAVAAIKSASSLNETANKIDVLFGASSKTINDFANTAASALGQSKKQALDAAADFGIFGKAAGLAGNDLADFAKQNTKLAADFASFYDTSPEEAITAIGAAYRGESEPIRRYGVLINEASLKDEALRMGLIKTTTEALQPQARVLAAQALILKQTSAAQGDFARTSGSLANQSRSLNAEFQNMLAALGQSLLPVAIQVAGAANDLLKSFNALSQPQKDLIVGFGLMAAAAGPVLTIGGKLVSTFGSMTSVFVDVAGGVVGASKTIGETAVYLKQAGVSADSLKTAFNSLKAGGVVLAAELGIIVAGLIAIAKYLGEVDAASKATTDDLIAMSKSGDVFKQAAASTEILAHGQDRLKAALDGVNAQLKVSGKEYADYKSSIDATAKAAGYQIDANGNLVVAFSGLGGTQTKVIQANYALTESEYKLAQAQQAATQGAYGQAGALDESNRAAQRSQVVNNMTIEQLTSLKSGLQEYYTAMRDSNAEGLARANEQAIQSIDLLKTAIQGAVGKELESFKNKQSELQGKADELQKTISTSYGKARDDAIKSLGEINTELAGNVKAHDEATKRILFDIAAQQLATIQDPQLRAKAMNEIALQWGLVDKATYDATQNIIAATAKLAKDENVEAFKANLQGIANEQLGIKPLDISVEPKINLDAIQTQPLPSVPLDVKPKIDQETLKEQKLTPIEVPAKVKIDVDSLKAAQGVAGDSMAERWKQLPSTVTTKVGVDTTQAAKDIQAFTTDKIGGLPKDKTTKINADTIDATKNTNALLNLFGIIPPVKSTRMDVEAEAALNVLGDVLKGIDDLYSKTIVVTVKYKTEGEPPVGMASGGTYIVPPNPQGSAGDYFPVLAAPGERVTVQTRSQQNSSTSQAAASGTTYNYTTNVYNPLAAAMLADQQRREKLARSNARMGVT